MTTIRGRLLALLLIGLTLVLAGGGAGVYWIADASLVGQLDASLETRASALIPLVCVDPRGLVLDLEDLWPQMLAGARFEFRAPGGEVLYRSEGLMPGLLPTREPAIGAPVFEDVQLSDDTAGRAAWLTFRPLVESDAENAEEADERGGDSREQVLAGAGAVPETLTVVVAADRLPVDRALATLMSALMVVGGVLGATMIALVTLGVRWGLGPLDRLGRQLANVRGEAISTRISSDGVPRELTPVYDELNRMLDRVGLTLERERLFASAAAHELRTPLAELRTTAEVAMRWPDAERATAALQDALAIGREMERLVESLLQISRGTTGEAAAKPLMTAIHPLVRDNLLRMQPQIDEKQLRVEVEVDANLALPAPRDAMEIIVRNLIDNAVQYTPAGGSIRIDGRHGSPAAPSLAVENGPVNMAQTDLAHLFEPFWRTDKARGDRMHYGLGLTVVRQVAQAAGLRVDASIAGKRLRIQVAGDRATPA